MNDAQLPRAVLRRVSAVEAISFHRLSRAVGPLRADTTKHGWFAAATRHGAKASRPGFVNKGHARPENAFGVTKQLVAL